MTEAKKRATRAPAARKVKQPKLPKPTWDIDGIDEWGASRHELGSTIPQAGNSVYNVTGGWRSMVPAIDAEKCTGCMLCYFFCPDASIIVEDGKAVGVDLAHCKGCGICATECPVDAIAMHVEEKE